MSSLRWLSVVLFVGGTSAWAEAPRVTATSRVDARRQLDAWAGNLEIGTGYLDPSGWAGELGYLPTSSVLEARASRALPLVQWTHYGLALMVGVTAVGTVRGPFDFGLGPHVGLVTGWTWSHFVFETGVQAGAEWFTRSGGPRYPLRWLLTAGPRVGPVDVLLTGKLGADLERAAYFALRYEGLLLARWRF